MDISGYGTFCNLRLHCINIYHLVCFRVTVQVMLTVSLCCWNDHGHKHERI